MFVPREASPRWRFWLVKRVWVDVWTRFDRGVSKEYHSLHTLTGMYRVLFRYQVRKYWYYCIYSASSLRASTRAKNSFWSRYVELILGSTSMPDGFQSNESSASSSFIHHSSQTDDLLVRRAAKPKPKRSTMAVEIRINTGIRKIKRGTRIEIGFKANSELRTFI